MKILITEKQINKVLRSLINEDDYSLHIGDLSKANKPYGGGTDSLYRMSGRGTGHFGSGTYLSTYKNENKELYNKYVEDKIYRNNFTKVDNGIYVVDLDYYNLYKPGNSKNANYLFQTLKLINQFFYSLCQIGYSNSTYDGLNENSKIRLKIIINNLEKLNLKLPPLKNFIGIVKNLCFTDGKDNAPSLSTIIMEYNGYNGVNVNNIEGWDNTTHGSVIYDISKTVKPNYDYNTSYNQNLFNTKLRVNDKKIVSDYESENKFYKKITPKTTIKEINYYINELTEPLEKIDWIMLDDLWKEGQISKEIYEHIPKVYSLKIKKLVDNGLRIDELNDEDIRSLLRIVDFNYINEKTNIDDLFYLIHKKQLYYSPNIQKFLKTVDEDKLEDNYWFNEIKIRLEDLYIKL
jgi:hypothetical protein